jgi:alpha-amylase
MPCAQTDACVHAFVLLQIRRRNGIVSDSKVKILAAESDMYVAEIGESVVLKLGPRWVTG